MATIDFATRLNSGLHPSRSGNTKVPYLAYREVDLADAAARKGSAVTGSDVIEAIDVPVDTVVMATGVRVMEAVTGGATGVSFTASGTATTVGSPDTVDVTVAATGDITGGVIRVYALLLDVSEPAGSGLAEMGS